MTYIRILISDYIVKCRFSQYFGVSHSRFICRYLRVRPGVLRSGLLVDQGLFPARRPRHVGERCGRKVAADRLADGLPPVVQGTGCLIRAARKTDCARAQMALAIDGGVDFEQRNLGRHPPKRKSAPRTLRRRDESRTSKSLEDLPEKRSRNVLRLRNVASENASAGLVGSKGDHRANGVLSGGRMNHAFLRNCGAVSPQECQERPLVANGSYRVDRE